MRLSTANIGDRRIRVRSETKDCRWTTDWVQHPEFDGLYDLTIDPHEERNVIHQATNRGLIERLRSDLGKLVQQSISL
jgi:hypothetical protein